MRWKAPARALEIREQGSLNLNNAFSVLQEEQYNQKYYEAMHQDEYKIQDDIQDPLAYLAISYPDAMYFGQAMKEPDSKEFLNALIREVKRHCELKHWKILPRGEVPKGQPILDLVWAMKIKRYIVNRQVYKCKARLNVHGGQQEYGVNYLDTYSPVVNWFSITTLLTMAAINKWHYIQVDFIQAYPQAPIDYELYMELPKDFNTKEGDGRTHILKLLKKLYVHNQVRQVYNHHLNDALFQVGFKQSVVDE